MSDDAGIPLIDLTARGGDLPVPLVSAAVPIPEAKSFIGELDLRASRDDDENTLRPLLHQYARDGRASHVRYLIQEHQNIPNLVNSADIEGLTALHFAARYTHLDVVRVLIELNANSNALTIEYSSPLHIAAKYARGHVVMSARTARLVPSASVKADSAAIVRELVQKGGSFINAKDKYGLTPLHYAAMKSNVPAASALLDLNADVKVEDDRGMTPLLTACVYGADDIVSKLLAKGADVTKGRAGSRTTSYHIAAQHGNLKTLKLLLEHGGEKGVGLLRLANSEGKTPLYLAVESNHDQVVEEILKIRQKDQSARSKLFVGKEKFLVRLAASRGYLNVIKVLREFGADLLQKDEQDRQALHMAAMNNHKDVVEYLIQNNVESLGARDEFGLTPLLLAASYKGAIDALKTLIAKGADIWAVNNEGYSIISIAAKYDSVKVLEYVLDLIKTREPDRLEEIVNKQDHIQNTAMHIVCNNGYLETAKLLKEYGGEIEVMNEDEETPLHLAALNGRTEVVRWIVDIAKRLVENHDEMGNTPLHLAAKNGHEAAVRILLDAGADREARNNREETPLIVAVDSGQIEVVTILAQKGAILENVIDHSATTPLHLAAARGNDEMVRTLLRYAPGLLAKRNPSGQTALDIAIQKGSHCVVLALIDQRDWRNLMKPTDQVVRARHNEPRKTPMREIIAQFPDVAATIFERCINRQPDGKEYDFTLLEDTFMMPSKENEEKLTSDIDPFDPETRKLLSEAQVYNQDHDAIYRNHPLKIIANSERMSLLGHPLVMALIKYKWNSLGRYTYYSALSIYILFIILYTSFIVYTTAPFNVVIEGTLIDLTETLSHNGTCTRIDFERTNFTVFLKWGIIFLAAAQLVKEAFQFYSRRLAYFSLDNLVECFIYITAIVTVVDFTDCSTQTGLRMPWQWSLVAVNAFLSWMNLLLLIRKLPRFGIYVVMFFDILRTFSRFFLVFVLFVIAFSIAFFVILQNRSEFSSVGASLLKTTVMMIGEFEYSAIFHGDDEAHGERLYLLPVAWPIFLLFCIVMTILLMNLLVGLAVDDIKSVQEKAELRRLSMQVDLVLQVETTIPWLRKKTCRSIWRTFPNRKGWLVQRLRDRFGFQQSSEEEDLSSVRSEEEEMIVELREIVRSQSAQIAHLQSNIDIMYGKQINTENMIKCLLKKNDIDFDNEIN